MAVSNHDSPSVLESNDTITEIDTEDSPESPLISNTEMVASTRNRSLAYLGSLVPIIFVVFLFTWTYVSYVFFWGIPSLQSHPSNAIVSLFLYHIFLALTIYSYAKAILTDPGTVSPNFTTQQTNSTEDSNICRKCGANKPERAHHCSFCKKCVVKMDHHCPWINNCVGHRNHKYFMLFLTYLVLTCFTGFFSLIQWIGETVFQKALSFQQIQVVITFLIAAIFGMVMLLFTIAQYRHVCRNVTTIEHMEKRRLWRRRRKQLLGLKGTRELTQSEKSELKGKFESPYDIGTRQNFEQIFGDKKWKWFLPFWNESTVDGVNWPTVFEEALPLTQQEPVDILVL